jgi:hypothetical protein
MARKINQVLWDQWRQRMERHRDSGLSIAEFCRREKVPRHGFHVWRRKLFSVTSAHHPSGGASRSEHSRKGQSVARPAQRPRQAMAKPAIPSRPTAFLQLPVAAAQGSPWIELVLADGTILRMPQQNLRALVAVLQVLRGEGVKLPEGEGCHA